MPSDVATDLAAVVEVDHPDEWGPAIGYANGISVPAGRMAFIAGQADLLEVGLHGVGVGERHGERGTGSPRRTDGGATPMCGQKRV